MHRGFAKFHRKLLEWEWYTDIPTKTLFFHLILKANHTDKNWRGVEIKRGQVLTSLDSLSKETGLTVQQVRTATKKLKSTGEITSKATSKNTVVTLCNYESYNPQEEESNKQVNKQPNKRTTNEQQTNNKQITTTKNEENEENEENVKNTPPTPKGNSIYEHWQSKKILVHKKNSFNGDIKTALNKYSEEDIIKAIDIYSEVYKSSDCWFTHRWGLGEFLSRDKALKVFVDKEVSDYKRDDSIAGLKVGSKKKVFVKEEADSLWLSVFDKDTYENLTWDTVNKNYLDGYGRTGDGLYFMSTNGEVFFLRKSINHGEYTKFSEINGVVKINVG